MGAFLNLFQSSHKKLCLRNDEQQLVVFVQYDEHLEHHHLGRLAVNPKYLGQGLAKILITNLPTQTFFEQLIKGTYWFVFKYNILGYDCYQSLDFIEAYVPEEP
jgi:ribosomal protein S18 acetylase RimI-like enzyme